jgi:acetylornithine/N-succinyldiaminopimelate aminotransferase
VGEHLKAALQKGLAAELASGAVKEIRGMGLMLGIDLSKPCGALVQRAADAGLLISVTADTVVRLVPSLILTTAEADQIAAILCPLISALLKETP